MQNRWSDTDAIQFVARYGTQHGADLASRTYTSRLIGADPQLVLHGGGNTSLKGVWTNIFGEPIDALFVKASGLDLATVEPGDHVAVDLAYLRRLPTVAELSDEAMINELRTHQFDYRAPTASIEAPVHAVVPGRFVDHTHADAILALTNQPDGERHVRRALGEPLVVLPYVSPGLQLARLAAEACRANPRARAMVWMRHGIVTWGDDARESYDRMIELVGSAEAYLRQHARRPLRSSSPTSVDAATARLAAVAPVVRGLLARPTGDPDHPHRRVILQPLVRREILDLLDSPEGRGLTVSPPLTPDHLIRIGVRPAWVEAPAFDDPTRLRAQLAGALDAYATTYQAYYERHAARLPADTEPLALLPHVVLIPGLGALCAGDDAHAARVARDITTQNLLAKAAIAAMGARYDGLDESHLFDMEYRTMQRAKLKAVSAATMAGRVAVVTGAAGAIGSGICERLLEHGAHVLATDLAGPSLEDLVARLDAWFPERVAGTALDVCDEASVEEGFAHASRLWGGVDVLIINAGLAHVAGLDELSLDDFRRLERVNTDGTLLLLRAAGRHFRYQGTGGDIVLVSTKNVFAPGARFGAYSATKAAAHQLARIASLEFAEHDVRVNMVAPDAVFAHGERRSGLWAAVGPDRMRARGLDAAGLEDYYRSRNLLKARVTADHVANAVLFFLGRGTPTTGATLPVDGGLPDATPR